MPEVTLSHLDELLGIPTLLVDGTAFTPRRSKLNFISGSAVEIVVADDSVNERTNITFNIGADATHLRGIELDAESFALPEDGEVVTYDSGTGKFVLSAGGGGGGSGDATSLQAVPLDAATVGAPNDGDVIVYDSITGAYKAASPGSLGLPSGTADDVLVYDGADWVADKLVNAHVDAAAAIAGSKIVPDFGAQQILTTGELILGTDPALAGLIRLPADGSIWARNAANDDDLAILTVDTDQIRIGAATGIAGVQYFTATGAHTFAIGATSVAVVGDRQLRVQVESSSGVGFEHGLKASFHDDEVTSAILALQKSRGTASAPTGVENGDDIGAILFSPYNGVDGAYDATAGIVARVIGVPAAGNVTTALDVMVGHSLGTLSRAARFNEFEIELNRDGVRLGSGSADAALMLSVGSNAFAALTLNDAGIGNVNVALGNATPSSWQSGANVAFVSGAATAPSAVDAAGAFLWSDASTSELRTHRAGVSDYLALRTATGLATAGHVRAGNALSIVARNNANGTDRTLLNWASDALSVGDGAYPVTVDASSSGFFVAIASGVRWTFNSTSITGGATSNVIGFTGTVAGQRIGGNNTSGTPQSLTVRAAGRVSSSGSGADLLLQGGKFNTSGSGGAVRLQYNPDDTTPVDRIVVDSTGIGFFGAAPIAKPSAGDLATLLTALENLGLITDTS